MIDAGLGLRPSVGHDDVGGAVCCFDSGWGTADTLIVSHLPTLVALLTLRWAFVSWVLASPPTTLLVSIATTHVPGDAGRLGAVPCRHVPVCSALASLVLFLVLVLILIRTLFLLPVGFELGDVSLTGGEEVIGPSLSLEPMINQLEQLV